MGVVVALITLASWCMNRHVCRHAIALDELRGESSRDQGPRRVPYFGWQGQLPFVGGYRIGPGLARLSGAAERSSILRSKGCVIRGENEAGLYPALGGVVVHAPLAVALDDRGRPISRRRRRGPPGTAFRKPELLLIPS